MALRAYPAVVDRPMSLGAVNLACPRRTVASARSRAFEMSVLVGVGLQNIGDEPREFVQVVQSKTINGTLARSWHDRIRFVSSSSAKVCSRINARSRSFSSSGTFSPGRIRCGCWWANSRVIVERAPTATIPVKYLVIITGDALYSGTSSATSQPKKGFRKRSRLTIVAPANPEEGQELVQVAVVG